jgi:hypothetical protein
MGEEGEVGEEFRLKTVREAIRTFDTQTSCPGRILIWRLQRPNFLNISRILLSDDLLMPARRTRPKLIRFV